MEPNRPVQSLDMHELQHTDSHLADIAKFDGSFAPSARPVDPLAYPWYKDSDYLTGGWLDPSIWRAAVCQA